MCDACLAAPAPFEAEYFCSACGTPFVNRYPLDEQGLCTLCRAGLRGFDAAYCYGAYEGALRELIHVYKYGGVRPLAKPLGRMMALAMPLDRRFDAVVAVPLHWRRRWARGFNQSGLLGREIARRCGVPLLNALRRKRPTATQAGLTNAQRRLNVSGAFLPRRKLAGLRILLVDDVLTTGATAAACANALKRAGAKSVSVLTLARVDRRIDIPTPSGLAKGAMARG